MDLKQLRLFVVLAETLNFHRAAERLHIAQPALSVSLRRLEDELGISLFERGRSGVALTAAGSAALPEAQRALQYAERVKEQAQAGADGEVGRVKLCYVGTATYDLLSRALTVFRSQFPYVAVELNESTTQSIVAGLEKGVFEIAIARYPLACPEGMEMEIVDRDCFWIALPPGHRLAKRKSLALAELSGDPFVLSLSGEAICQAVGFVPRIVQRAVQLQTMMCLVESGLGVSLIPSMIAKRMEHRLVCRPLSDVADIYPTGFALLYPNRPLKRPAQHFRDVVLSLSGRKA